MTHWYVEPRWAAQHELDAEIARFATEATLATRRTLPGASRRSGRRWTRSRRDLDGARHSALATLRAQQDEVVSSMSTRERARSRSIAAIAAERDRFDEAAAQVSARNRELEQLVLLRAPTGEVTKLRDELAQMMQRLGVASAHGADFDYVAFEDRFRGDSQALAVTQREYVSKFPAPAEVGAIVDVGCGRGEMLEVLRDAGHEVIGVDLDDNMVAVCAVEGAPGRQERWRVVVGSVSRRVPRRAFSRPRSSNTCSHRRSNASCRASQAALRNGGVLVIETINPRSLHALANHFFADLSHVRPVHPETLRFMCEQTGFSEVALMELSPHPAVEAAKRLGDDPADEAIRQLVSSVFGFQDYAIVATKRS